jgi:hypothetical protein
MQICIMPIICDEHRHNEVIDKGTSKVFKSIIRYIRSIVSRNKSELCAYIIDTILSSTNFNTIEGLLQSFHEKEEKKNLPFNLYLLHLSFDSKT